MKAYVVVLDGKIFEVFSSREEAEECFDPEVEDGIVYEIEVPEELHLLLRAQKEVESDNAFHFRDDDD